MRMSDWSSDVCSSDLGQHALVAFAAHFGVAVGFHFLRVGVGVPVVGLLPVHLGARVDLGFAAAAVLAVLLVGRFFGFGLLVIAAVLGPFLQRLVALDQVEVAQRQLRGLGKGGLDRKSVVSGKSVSELVVHGLTRN